MIGRCVFELGPNPGNGRAVRPLDPWFDFSKGLGFFLRAFRPGVLGTALNLVVPRVRAKPGGRCFVCQEEAVPLMRRYEDLPSSWSFLALEQVHDLLAPNHDAHFAHPHHQQEEEGEGSGGYGHARGGATSCMAEVRGGKTRAPWMQQQPSVG